MFLGRADWPAARITLLQGIRVVGGAQFCRRVRYAPKLTVQAVKLGVLFLGHLHDRAMSPVRCRCRASRPASESDP
jgi:hypothetical protein